MRGRLNFARNLAIMGLTAYGHKYLLLPHSGRGSQLLLLMSETSKLKTVGVSMTFQSFVGATFISFAGPTVFVYQQRKSLICWSSFVAPTYFGFEKCWRYFFPFVGPTILVPDLQNWALQSDVHTFYHLLDLQFKSST